MGVAAAVDASSHAAQVPSYKREEEILSTQAVQVPPRRDPLCGLEELQIQAFISQECLPQCLLAYFECFWRM